MIESKKEIEVSLELSRGTEQQSCAGESSKSSEHLQVEEETQDHGENSTTLSSIDAAPSSALLANANLNVIRPASANEYQDSDSQYQKNFECFRKEDEFKQLLENLDIENIEIDLSVQTK